MYYTVSRVYKQGSHTWLPCRSLFALACCAPTTQYTDNNCSGSCMQPVARKRVMKLATLLASARQRLSRPQYFVRPSVCIQCKRLLLLCHASHSRETGAHTWCQIISDPFVAVTLFYFVLIGIFVFRPALCVSSVLFVENN